MTSFLFATTILFVKVLIFINVPSVLGSDGELTAPANWINGGLISVNCTIKSSALENCVNNGKNLTDTKFRKDLALQCSVALSWESKCLNSSPSYYPDLCWCEKNASGYVKYVYRFWADPQVHNGTWTCEKGCRAPNSFITDPFNISLDNGVDKKVTYNVMQPSQSCKSSTNRMAVILPERTEAVYIDCSQQVDDKWEHIAIAFIVVCIVLVCVVAGLSAYIIYKFCRGNKPSPPTPDAPASKNTIKSDKQQQQKMQSTPAGQDPNSAASNKKPLQETQSTPANQDPDHAASSKPGK